MYVFLVIPDSWKLIGHLHKVVLASFSEEFCLYFKAKRKCLAQIHSAGFVL